MGHYPSDLSLKKMPSMTPKASNGTELVAGKFAEFAAPAAGPSWLAPLRKAGLASFADQGFPTLQDEDWRFTNLALMARLNFQLARPAVVNGAESKAIADSVFAGMGGHRLVFVNGFFCAPLSRLQTVAAGVRIESLAAALAEDTGLIQRHLGQQARLAGNSFAALNQAFFSDGAFLFVPAGVEVAEPVQLLYISSAKQAGEASMPRNLVVAGPNSKLTVVESYLATSEEAYFTNAVTEILAGENSRVEHVKLQDEAPGAFHIATIAGEFGRASNVTVHSFALGARLSRNNIRAKLAGEGLECILNGLYLTRDEQLADHHMIVEHAKQTNKNLLLSDHAGVDTKPQLEIYADDVKCTHGATIGQLNAESIFYLRSRGMSQDTARRMLIHAFAGEIIERIQCEPARAVIDKLVWDRLEARLPASQP